MITVKYSCKECGIVNKELQVPARETADQDVCAWMDDVIRIVGDDHRSTSPRCKATKLGDLMIPLKHKDGTEAEFIGQQIE